MAYSRNILLLQGRWISECLPSVFQYFIYLSLVFIPSLSFLARKKYCFCFWEHLIFISFFKKLAMCEQNNMSFWFLSFSSEGVISECKMGSHWPFPNGVPLIIQRFCFSNLILWLDGTWGLSPLSVFESKKSVPKG